MKCTTIRESIRTKISGVMGSKMKHTRRPLGSWVLGVLQHPRKKSGGA